MSFICSPLHSGAPVAEQRHEMTLSISCGGWCLASAGQSLLGGVLEDSSRMGRSSRAPFRLLTAHRFLSELRFHPWGLPSAEVLTVSPLAGL